QAELKSFAAHPLVGETMGVGMFGAIELVADKASKKPFEPAGSVGGKVAAAALESGLMVRNMADRLAVCPPLIITEAELHDLFGRLRRAMDTTLATLKSEGTFKG